MKAGDVLMFIDDKECRAYRRIEGDIKAHELLVVLSKEGVKMDGLLDSLRKQQKAKEAFDMKMVKKGYVLTPEFRDCECGVYHCERLWVFGRNRYHRRAVLFGWRLQLIRHNEFCWCNSGWDRNECL